MALSYTYSHSWNYPFCDSCLKNSHHEEKMVLRKVTSTNDDTKCSEMYICTKCGFSRRI